MFGEFKFLLLVHDGETKSYAARHPAFYRTVLLHLLPRPDSPERKLIQDYLERLSPEGRAQVLDQGEHDGQSYLVTQLDFRNLVEWLEKVTLPASPTKPREPTSDFGGSVSQAPPPPPPQSEKTRGEFTEMFSPLNPAVLPNPPLDPRPKSRPKRLGSFTKAFQGLLGKASPPEPHETPVPPPRSGPPRGEFTRMFEAPLPPAGEPPEPGPPSRKPDPTARPAFQQRGSFTQVFGPAPPDAEPPPPPIVSPPPSTEAVKPEPPDEFGHRFGPLPEEPAEAASVPPPAAAQAPAQQLQPKRSASSNLPIILILVLLVLAAIVLIAYFALRRSTD